MRNAKPEMHDDTWHPISMPNIKQKSHILVAKKL